MDEDVGPGIKHTICQRIIVYGHMAVQRGLVRAHRVRVSESGCVIRNLTLYIGSKTHAYKPLNTMCKKAHDSVFI